MKYYITFFLPFVIGTGVSGEQCFTDFHTEFACVVPYGVPSDDVWYRSHIDCARACSRISTCASLFYFQASQMCRQNEYILINRTNSCPEPQQYTEKVMNTECTSTVYPTTTSTTSSLSSTTSSLSSTTSSLSSITTQSTTSGFSVPSQWMYMYYPYFFMNDPCTTSPDCDFILNAECQQSMCQCISGYSFDWTTYSCVSACASYGHSYQIEYDTAYQGGHYVQLNNVYEDECLQQCTDYNGFTCMSAVYDITGMTCKLSNETALTQPVQPLLSYNLYQRDCLFV